MDDIPVLPDYVSSSRSSEAERLNVEYRSVPSLDQARKSHDFAVVLEGDDGGQIYASCPVDLVVCDEPTLRELLCDVDAIQWDEPGGCGLYFELAPSGTHLAGGMGGGEVIRGVWCHEEIHAIKMDKALADVLTGRSNRLVIPTIEELEANALTGDISAQYFLGQRLRRCSVSQSLRWYRAAADQGHRESMNWLSITRQVPYEERVRWTKLIIASSGADERLIDWAKWRLAHLLMSAPDGPTHYNEIAHVKYE